MIQIVLELDLADYPSPYGGYDAYEFERQEREQIEQLHPGALVRLNVGRCKPYSLAGFFRKDLVWQVIGKDGYALKDWLKLLEGKPLVDL